MGRVNSLEDVPIIRLRNFKNKRNGLSLSPDDDDDDDDDDASFSLEPAKPRTAASSSINEPISKKDGFLVWISCLGLHKAHTQEQQA